MGLFSKVAAFVMLALLSLSFAEDFVAVNSVDGRDVLSGIFYAGVKGYPVRFMPYPGGNSEVFATKVGSGHSILIIQSATPASGFAESELRSKNNSLEIYSSTDGGQTNLDLAARSGAGSFIIVDSAYSDSAISVLPYAYLTKSYVILADRNNIAKVKEIVRGKKVTIYGLVDSAVRTELSEFSPATIGTGADKYEDNVAIAGMTLDASPSSRAIITDGASIEDGMVGVQPILLSGRIVPQVTYDFLKQKVREDKLAGVMLIGGELINPVYDMRERMKTEFAQEGISKSMGVLVKFAQALPSAQGGTLALDVFQLPAYKPSLNITEIVYNKETKKVMVGLENTGDGALYYNIEVKVKANGQDLQIFGQTETQLIERGQSVGLEYPIDLSSVSEGAVTATAVAKFGSAKKSLEEFITSDGALASITYTDDSNVSVKYAKYERDKSMVSVAIKNNGDKAAFVFTRITLMSEDGTPAKVSGPSIREIEPYAIYIEQFPLQLSDSEVSLNKEVSVSLDYGGRRGFLVRKANYALPLEGDGAQLGAQLPLAVAGIGALVLLLIIVAVAAYFIMKRKK